MEYQHCLSSMHIDISLTGFFPQQIMSHVKIDARSFAVLEQGVIDTKGRSVSDILQELLFVVRPCNAVDLTTGIT